MTVASTVLVAPTRNLYNVQELAGAFGDLGTLIPFVVGYITINHMDPAGILVGFGVFKLWAGLYFKTPVPIQPMKAIGTAARRELEQMFGHPVHLFLHVKVRGWSESREHYRALGLDFDA